MRANRPAAAGANAPEAVPEEPAPRVSTLRKNQRMAALTALRTLLTDNDEEALALALPTWFTQPPNVKSGLCPVCYIENLPLHQIKNNGVVHPAHSEGGYCPKCLLNALLTKLSDPEATDSCIFDGCDVTIKSEDLVGILNPALVEQWAVKFEGMLNASNIVVWKNQWNMRKNRINASGADLEGCFIMCPYCLETNFMPRKNYACGYSSSHVCKKNLISKDMKRIFPIEPSGGSQYCLFCSRPSIEDFHYKNTIDGDTAAALQPRTKANVVTFASIASEGKINNGKNGGEGEGKINIGKQKVCFLNRPDCGGPREMIARFLAVEDKLASQMKNSPATLNTQAANNERAVYSQMNFPRFLEAADAFLKTHPDILAKCGETGGETPEEEERRKRLQVEFALAGVPGAIMGGKRKKGQTRRVKRGRRKAKTMKRK